MQSMKFIIEIDTIIAKELAYFLDANEAEALHEAIAKSLCSELDMDINEARGSVKVILSIKDKEPLQA